MKEKHIFAGNNTAEGFYSCFDYLFNPNELEHIYILKGGPGVGKSSFMKKFASETSNNDYSIEYIHCSSDNDSLDGIIIPQLKIALVDGTAPHTVDPRIPGVIDEIINLGMFLDNSQLEKRKEQIIQINKTKSLLFKSAYRYLHAAGIITEEINSLYDQFIDREKFYQMNNEAVNKLFHNSNNLKKAPKTKKMFSEAYTASGYIDYTKSLCQNKRVWVVTGESTNHISEFLKKISYETSKRGYDSELFLMPLNPDKLKHIYIPEMNLIIISSEDYAYGDFEEIFDIHGIMDTDNLRTHISEIENNLHLYDLLIKNALEKLSESKKYHKLLEVFYINSMDFNGVDECFNSIINRFT
jgi:hypothetical protein